VVAGTELKNSDSPFPSMDVVKDDEKIKTLTPEMDYDQTAMSLPSDVCISYS
jgi:hypothetical protein